MTISSSEACIGIVQSVSKLLSMEFDLSDAEPGTINGGSTAKKSKQRKRKSFMVDEEGEMGSREKLAKKILLSLTRPSYVLGLGPKPLRKEHRTRLRYLLHRLVNQHHWVEASGVLSAYMKGTLNETSPFRNRLKFWVPSSSFCSYYLWNWECGVVSSFIASQVMISFTCLIIATYLINMILYIFVIISSVLDILASF